MAPPVGRAAVSAALLDAAEAELASVGVKAASIRRIAARAGVNHGLVHRHFGSKDKLVTAVLDRLAAQVAAALDDTDTADLLDPGGPLARQLRVLARAALDGVDLTALQSTHPAADRLVAAFRNGTPGLPEDRARRAAGHAMALAFGLQLLGPFIAEATGSDETDLRHDLLNVARALTATPTSTEPAPGTGSAPPVSGAGST